MSTVTPPRTGESSRPPLDNQNPWPGLDSFHESDRGFFRGRTQDVRDLLGLIERARVAILYGVSGVGKSSLLEAGLFPLLRERGMLPIRIRLDFSTEASDLIAQVKHAICAQGAAARIEAPAANEPESLWEYFHRHGQSFWDERNRLIAPVLVFDQFEEVFTLGREGAPFAPRTRDLLDQIADLVEGRPPEALLKRLRYHPEAESEFVFRRHHYRIVIAMREDFLAQFDDLRSQMPSITHNRKRLLPMDGQAALEVVNQAPHLISQEVAEQIVRFIGKADSPDRSLAEVVIDPALLSVMCSELNEKRRQRGETLISEDLVRSSSEAILHDFYERAMRDVSPATRRFVEERLILDPGYRDTVALAIAFRAPGVTLEDIERLIDRRLLHVEQRGSVRRIELTHDLLVGVIQQSRDKRHAEEKAEQERAARLEAEQRELITRRNLRGALIIAAFFIILSLVAARETWVAWREEREAVASKDLLSTTLNDVLSLAGNQPQEYSGDSPQLQELRGRLLTEALDIYQRSASRSGNPEDMRTQSAMAHFYWGDIYRLRAQPDKAISEYNKAIGELSSLAASSNGTPAHRKALADAYNWLGETERPIPQQSAEAEKAYDDAIAEYETLSCQFPENQEYRAGLARAYYNRGILMADTGRTAAGERDYRHAIGLLAPLANTKASTPAIEQFQQDLGHAYNNLARLLYSANRTAEARGVYDQAIGIGERLARRNPDNWQWQMDLAQYYNNAAILLQQMDDAVHADERNKQALSILSRLAQPAPSLVMRIALAHSVRGRILASQRLQAAAQAEYQSAIDTFEQLPAAARDRYFYVWFGQTLFNMAELKEDKKDYKGAIPLLTEAIDQQKKADSKIDLAWDYYYLALAYQAIGEKDSSDQALSNCRQLLPALPDADRQELTRLLGSR